MKQFLPTLVVPPDCSLFSKFLQSRITSTTCIDFFADSHDFIKLYALLSLYSFHNLELFYDFYIELFSSAFFSTEVFVLGYAEPHISPNILL